VIAREILGGVAPIIPVDFVSDFGLDESEYVPYSIYGLEELPVLYVGILPEFLQVAIDM